MNSHNQQFWLGLDPFILFLIFKFKFIDFENTKFKFIGFAKVEFKFISNSWADLNSILHVRHED